MFDPSKLQNDEAWIAFKLNDAPIYTEADGNYNVFAIMDAASCFILGAEFVSAESDEPSQLESLRLLKRSYSNHQLWPRSLYVATDMAAEILCKEAEQQGIAVIRVPEEQLLVCIGEAQQGFREHVSRGAVQ